MLGVALLLAQVLARSSTPPNTSTQPAREVTVFRAGDGGFPCIRVPSLIAVPGSVRARLRGCTLLCSARMAASPRTPRACSTETWAWLWSLPCCLRGVGCVCADSTRAPPPLDPPLLPHPRRTTTQRSHCASPPGIVQLAAADIPVRCTRAHATSPHRYTATPPHRHCRCFAALPAAPPRSTRTLLAFAECRNFDGDGCNVPGLQPGDETLRVPCMKRSDDSGASWGNLSVVTEVHGMHVTRPVQCHPPNGLASLAVR